jgi:capsular exopolysaccharide synthesis family protein
MDDYEFDIRSFFGLLQRQVKLIVLTVVAVLAISTIVVFSLKPMYTASALIMVDPSRKNLLDPEMQGGSSSADSARIDSEVEILRSDNVLLQVIKADDLVQDPEFGVSLSSRSQLLAFLRLAEPTEPTGDQALNQSLSKLRGAVSVQRRGGTYLISLQVRSASPAKAAQLANAVASAYIADQLTSKVQSALASRDILQARIADARNAILVSEGSFDNFVASNIDSIVRDTGRTDLATMQSQIEELTNSRQSTLALANQAQASIDNGDFASLTSGLQSEALAELARQREALQASISNTATGSPTALDLRTELAAIEDRLRQQATTEVEALRNQVAQAQASETSLREDLRTNVLQSNLSANTLTQLYELQQGAELARAQYQTLLSRVQDLEAQATLQVADSRIVSPALAPNGASFPNTGLILSVATLAAIGLGIALAFLYENVLGGFTSEAQLESVLKTRVATAVPRIKAKAGGGSIADLMVESPLSIFAESIRRVRAQIDQALRQRPAGADAAQGSIVVVTSTAPGEGKSTIALSLARSFALSGRSTLLIDCDLRKPSIHKQLNLEPSQGILEFLTDAESVDIAPILKADTVTNAVMLLGARRSGTPTDQLIAGRSFQRLIDAARRSFDIVVIDTPPIGAVVDGLYVAPAADAVVYIVRWASTSQNDARESMRNLESATPETTPIFAVLNQQDRTKGSYSNKYGDYYSEYT